jgi:hypothetical protein
VETYLEGKVHASRYDPGAPGKQFLGATIQCSDGTVWVISYGEQSPYHLFADRQVIASGEPYEPEGQQMIIVGAKDTRHFNVSTMRLTKVTPDAKFVEVGTERDLRGRFGRVTTDTGDSTLSFATEEGEVYLVANDPAGAAVGACVDVTAYPVQPLPSLPTASKKHLWVFAPCSMEDIWEWRERRS